MVAGWLRHRRLGAARVSEYGKMTRGRGLFPSAGGGDHRASRWRTPMANTSDRHGSCECHMMEIVAELPTYPIKFIVEQRGFYLHELRLSHCMFCGGELPKLEYDWQAPDSAEEKDAISIV